MLKPVTGINYVKLWGDLVRLSEERRQRKSNTLSADQWHGKADKFDQRVADRWKEKDTSRAFVVQTLRELPDATVMDIGAGSGAWVSLMSPLAKKVTAIDPSQSMLARLKKRVAEENLENVTIVAGYWPQVQASTEVHDVSFCSHSMYGAQDLPGFVNAIQTATKRRVIFLLRAPFEDGLMAQAAKLIWGLPFDSPNYQIAMHILWQMGIFPNVIMEEDHLWKPWSHASMADALAEMKNRLGLFENQEWDEQLLAILRSNLVEQSGEYIWPSAIRTALLYWDK